MAKCEKSHRNIFIITSSRNWRSKIEDLSLRFRTQPLKLIKKRLFASIKFQNQLDRPHSNFGVIIVVIVSSSSSSPYCRLTSTKNWYCKVEADKSFTDVTNRRITDDVMMMNATQNRRAPNRKLKRYNTQISAIISDDCAHRDNHAPRHFLKSSTAEFSSQKNTHIIADDVAHIFQRYILAHMQKLAQSSQEEFISPSAVSAFEVL